MSSSLLVVVGNKSTKPARQHDKYPLGHVVSFHSHIASVTRRQRHPSARNRPVFTRRDYDLPLSLLFRFRLRGMPNRASRGFGCLLMTANFSSTTAVSPVFSARTRSLTCSRYSRSSAVNWAIFSAPCRGCRLVPPLSSLYVEHNALSKAQFFHHVEGCRQGPAHSEAP